MRKSNLLIVEDDRVDAMLIQRALKEIECPLKIDRAENGLRALELLEEYNNDICFILLDLNMPFMNGFEFMKRKNSNERFKDIPVIIFSTSNNEDERQLSREMGALAYLVKPVDYESYKATLKILDWSKCE